MALDDSDKAIILEIVKSNQTPSLSKQEITDLINERLDHVCGPLATKSEIQKELKKILEEVAKTNTAVNKIAEETETKIAALSTAPPVRQPSKWFAFD